jgi:hypothetical protein
MGTQNDINISLELNRLDFERTKNPMHLIAAFVYAHQFGKEPPAWVLNHMAKIFKSFVEARGTVSLDKLFGFSRGKGQSPAMKEHARQQHESMVMLDICTLKSLFDLSTSEAAAMVARKIFSDKERNKEFQEDDLVEADKEDSYTTTIADTYSRHSWQKKFRTDPYLSFLLSLNLNMDKIQYLRRFPKDAWPDKLKHQYK